MKRAEVLQGLRQTKFAEVPERTKRLDLTHEEAASMPHQDGSTDQWVPGQWWDLIVTMDDAGEGRAAA